MLLVEDVCKHQVGMFLQFFEAKALQTLLSCREVGGSLTLVMTVTTTPPSSPLSVVLRLPKVVLCEVLACARPGERICILADLQLF